MILDARMPEKPAGVLIDHGTGRRIPFARTVDFSTGEYTYLCPAPNGVDILVDPYTRRPFVRKGKAVGRLELVPFEKAAAIGCKAPEKVESNIQPMSPDERIEGMRQYQRCFMDVEKWRGNSRRVIDTKFEEFCKQSSFLDSFVIRRTVPTKG